MSTAAIVRELKEQEQDFEFYPTTDEILSVIAPYMHEETVLDIGCGACHFYKYMSKQAEIDAEIYNANHKDEKYFTPINRWNKNVAKIDTYYVIEKSKPLLAKLEDYAICVGTDFYVDSLIDKKVSTIFCNPPYSDYENWMKKIITDGNFKQAFLVIPRDWEKNASLQAELKAFDTTYDILGEFDFLNAERQARANVHVVRLRRNKYINSYKKQEDFDRDAFDVYFNQIFGHEAKRETEYAWARRREEEQQNKMDTALVVSDKSIAETLVDLYNEDREHMLKSLNAIMELDPSLLATFDISVDKIKDALIEKIKGLKALYWKKVWDKVPEITTRLTTKERNKLQQEYEYMYNVDFTMDNIWMLIQWVIKNASKRYNGQLIDFFRSLSDEENVKPYKSNQKLFNREEWRYSSFRANEHDNYVLDYRIIMSSPFREGWHGEFQQEEYQSRKTINDIIIIAKNLGFGINEEYELPDNFSKKAYVYMKDGSAFMEYKAYKNGNLHVKFNTEFTKAMNVEVARLLGWIRCKEDIQREFPAEMAKGAEKYFNINFTAIGTSTLLLTTSN